MIIEKCFTKDWLESFKKQARYSRVDKIILEKMIHAFHLLERLRANGLDFIFKGGTSLVLLMDEGNRFSIDIDIICKTSRQELEAVLQKILETSRFKGYELDERRSYNDGVPKAHYGFTFDTATSTKYSGRILLDVLIEDSIYPECIKLPIATKWIEMEGETIVALPSINSITGDKLTAFAPNTIGIPYFRGGQSFAMEICKQLFDLSRLFERIDNMKIVAESFQAFAKKEIEYRKNKEGAEKLTPQMVLQDTIDTCLIIAKKGTGNADEKKKFKELQKGIKAFGTGFLMEGNFRIDDAVPAAARVALIAVKILAGELSSLKRYEGQDIKELNIDEPEWNFLNRLKKQPDKSGFFYWYQTFQLLMTF